MNFNIIQGCVNNRNTQEPRSRRERATGVSFLFPLFAISTAHPIILTLIILPKIHEAHLTPYLRALRGKIYKAHPPLRTLRIKTASPTI